MKLERIRRSERLEVCKAVEVAMLQAQEEGADLDAKSQILENLAEDEAEDAAAGNHGASFPAPSGTHQDALSACSLPDTGGNIGSNEGKPKPPARCEGFADLVAALSEVPAHENKRQHLASILQQTEDQTRSEIADAARLAAGFRQDKSEFHSFIEYAPWLEISQTCVLLNRVPCGGTMRMAKQRDAERLPLERETAILRQELAEMTSEEEVRRKTR
ncbi:unnamed protein product [Ectocarpus sp. CCAP 1310/34]|nr:unnamed protein product [Ectocarpus sp. CCAP 1310/34]